MSADDIVIRVVQPHEYEQVVQFIIDHFYRDEPLCSSEPKVVPGETDRADIMECLKGGTSILAMQIKENGEEELVGVNVGVPKDPSSVDKYFKNAEKEGNTKYGQVLKFLGVANRQADLFNRYGVDKLFYSFMSCVTPTCRGRNLGTRLKEELMALAKKLGYKLVTVDCSSFYSARLCKRMGWDVANFIAYSDYKDENGQVVFPNIPPPHEGLTTLAVRV
ncbi:arylalkylamine N-acetyltransferase-like 2 [Lucilia cuprina]|uniref:arylalkylamine N-acetyltransferase-like 2 n=1 Tax=Lucilia cuprina TaxID=7375 RepID=UPI001F06342B|nr:arylalkylamine N-acetyltransferase-like 2 [Lucilia cuprina]